MDPPLALSLEEIRKYMLLNNCKVTNHALVKHFRKFLTNPDSQEEARKLFKSYVNILATMKSENNEKFLVLRKKYLHECPPEDIVNKTIDCPSPASPGNSSISSENFSSPFRQPPPYKPPPEVSPNISGLPKVVQPTLQQQNVPISFGIGVPKEMTSNYRECVNEFAAAVRRIDPNRIQETVSSIPITSDESLHSNDVLMQEQEHQLQQQPPILPPRKRTSIDQNSIGSLSRENSHEENKENVDDKGNLPEKNNNIGQRSNNEIDNKLTESENQISVKEATRKFNRMASEEEAKVVSPPSKKKPEKTVEETPEVTLAHPKAKEWLVSAAKANYQELAKLLADHPELVRLQNLNYNRSETKILMRFGCLSFISAAMCVCLAVGLSVLPSSLANKVLT
ncbi:ankyrin repeat domain-containing protein SOWAHB-like [Condylostylus longicornis]|uniref:ankyrin repeat domain-containing protein SOWAHB-like n=1 Tax=Condylostylus longicornis TaxID=2530218 RepID=UPI00244DFFD9|nr:ankyrin repeat domain-containing protein SOWAHB-like [Condylostylus longicornis]